MMLQLIDKEKRKEIIKKMFKIQNLKSLILIVLKTLNLIKPTKTIYNQELLYQFNMLIIFLIKYIQIR